MLAIASLQMGLVVSSNTSVVVGTLVFLSFGTTITATALIIYRIRRLSKHASDGLEAYGFTTEVLLESGALYAATQLVVCALLVTHGTPFNAGPTWQGIPFWVGIVTPMAVSSGLYTNHNFCMVADMRDISARRELPQH